MRMGGGFGGIGAQRGMGGQAERSPRSRSGRDVPIPRMPSKAKKKALRVFWISCRKCGRCFGLGAGLLARWALCSWPSIAFPG